MTKPLLALGLLLSALSAPLAASDAPAPRPLDDRPLDDKALTARYALPGSRFAEIAGERVHYVSQGKGPAILLLHGSYASLRQWDDWAKRLSRRYRVVRYDQSPAGLSGPSPSGDYSVEHRIAVIDGLMDRLGIARFVIVGTSSAGLPAAAYAAARPQRVNGVVLNNIAAGPLKFDFDNVAPALKAAVTADAAHPGWHSGEFWRQIMLANMVDASRVTPALVGQWTDLNNRMLRDPEVGKAAAAASSFARTPDDLRRITAPTLLLWSAQDHETPADKDGRQALDLLASQDKSLEIVDNCGHMMPLDCPARALGAALPFLARVAGK